MPGVTESRTFDSVLTTTLANYREKLVDNIFDEYAFLSYLNGKLGKAIRNGGSIKRLLDGGDSIVEHLLYETNSTISSYSGSETIDTTIQDGMTIARYNWKQYGGSIGFTGLEKAQNSGQAAMIDLIEARTKQAIMTLRKNLNQDAFGDGTGNSNKTLTGLQALVSTTATVGGLNPTTFAWWVAQSTTSGVFSTQGLADMTTTFYNCAQGSSDTPDAIFTTQTILEAFENTLVPQQRYGNEDELAKVGWRHLTFKSVPVFYDLDCPSGNMYFLNSKYLNFCVHKNHDFVITPAVTREDKDTTSSKILFYGNMTTNNRRKLGVMTSITAS